MRVPGGVPTAHVDTFARALLPPPEAWPALDYSEEPLCRYPDRINAAATLLDAAIAAGCGDKPVFHYEGCTWTYRHLYDRVDRLARVLVEDYGLVPGNRVLLRSGNNPMLAACWLAVLKAGGICVTTMPLLRTGELAFILNRVEVSIALCDESLADEMEAARPAAATLRHTAYFSPAGLGHARAANLDRAADAKAPGFGSVATAADDIALITFTSGTTGSPKAAAHFHRDILAICEGYPGTYAVDPGDVICGSPSAAFTYGLAAFIIYPLRYLASVAFVSRPTPDRILNAVERYRVNSLYCVPTSYFQMLGELDKFDIRSLRKCASAGENLQTQLFKHWHDRTGIRLVNGLGATEMLTHFLSETMEVDRIGSTGKAVPHYAVRLIDAEGQRLPPDSRGRLAVRGPTGCRYLDDLERQKAFVINGWNVTGDVCVEDRDGYFWFVDRADDMIVSSGYNISPQEVERALAEHPLVSQCAVVGVKDTARGNLVRAWVVLNNPALATAATVRELQEFVKHRIAPYKYPRDVRFCDALPRTYTGKIQRNVLRAMATGTSNSRVEEPAGQDSDLPVD